MRRETGSNLHAVPVMRWFRLLFALLFIPLAACALNGPRTVLDTELDHPYTLDSGDVVKVSVYGDYTISRTYRIDDAGNIAFPLVGQVQVRGMSTAQAAAAITAKLANGYMKSPNVTAEVDTYRPFYISGAVAAPGQFPYVPGMTVRAAIATAGGVVQGSGIHTQATIYRKLDDGTVKSRVDLDFPIQAGDTVVVD